MASAACWIVNGGIAEQLTRVVSGLPRDTRDGHPPRRTIVFMTVSGEEEGLWGSDYYASHPVFPLNKTTIDLNTDMIGRVDPNRKIGDSMNYVYVIGHDKLSSDLPISRQAVAKHLATLGRAGLVSESHRGREHRFELDPRPLADAAAWLTSVGAEWDTKLADLQRFFHRALIDLVDDGMSVRVVLEAAKPEQALVIPQAAIQSRPADANWFIRWFWRQLNTEDRDEQMAWLHLVPRAVAYPA